MHKVDLISIVLKAMKQDHKRNLFIPVFRYMHHAAQGIAHAVDFYIFFHTVSLPKIFLILHLNIVFVNIP